jgi:2,5-diketo-D-gluconate reductase A
MKSLIRHIAFLLAFFAVSSASFAQTGKVETAKIPTVTLSNGVKMPKLGFGTLYLKDSVGVNGVAKAILLGYRLIDCAAIYGNEVEVGQGIKKSGIDRKELFISSKLWIADMGYENTKKGFEETIKKLGVDYLDMYIIHRPHGDVPGSWKAMEELYKEGKIKAISVSNFDAAQLADLLAIAKIKPVINQIEINPYFQQPEFVKTVQKLGLQVEGWSPFAQGRNGMFTNEVLVGIGKKYNKTAAQVVLRWLMQRDVVAIPRTENSAYMKENLNIFDFKLSEADMKEISKLDKKTSQFPEWK